MRTAPGLGSESVSVFGFMSGNGWVGVGISGGDWCARWLWDSASGSGSDRLEDKIAVRNRDEGHSEKHNILPAPMSPALTDCRGLRNIVWAVCLVTVPAIEIYGSER